MTKYDVFISYSRKDKKNITEFCEKLSKAGIKYWIDNQGISNGEEFKTVIVKAIEESKIVVFISSIHSNSSEWTAKEIGIAVARGKHIIPIKLDNSTYNKAVEFDLINIDYVDCTSKSAREKAMDKLIATIKNKCFDTENIQKISEQNPSVPSTKRNGFNKIKILIFIVVLMVISIFVVIWRPNPPHNDKDTLHIITDPYEHAKTMLNSNIKDSVILGYNEMLKLANNGDNRAKIEIGITNFSLLPKNDKSKEYRTDSILARRKHLGMKDGNTTELTNTVKYFTSITDSTVICPEMYYILGMIYFNQGTKEAVSKALNAFKISTNLIEKGYSVSHGYKATDLKNRMKRNIKTIETKILKTNNLNYEED